MSRKKSKDDGRKWFVVIGGINDGVKYTTPAAEREVRLIGRFRDRIALPEGQVEMLPAH